MIRGSYGAGAAPGDRPGGVSGKVEKRVELSGVQGRHRVVMWVAGRKMLRL